ncbi:RNA chaperone Hfq [Vibrio owensii]|uniref:RNA chaperone Hfq n=1 Tax=Vibrio harveyi group TaxID=717610 RepID=UPI003CC50C2F
MTSTTTTTVKTAFLEALQSHKIPVNIFLANGIKLQGRITQFDDRNLILANGGTPQVAKLRAISTIVPSQIPELADKDLVSDSEMIDAEFMDMLIEAKHFSKIYLLNGVGLEGYIKAYDESCVLLENKNIQLVMETSISTIAPHVPQTHNKY